MGRPARRARSRGTSIRPFARRGTRAPSSRRARRLPLYRVLRPASHSELAVESTHKRHAAGSPSSAGVEPRSEHASTAENDSASFLRRFGARCGRASRGRATRSRARAGLADGSEDIGSLSRVLEAPRCVYFGLVRARPRRRSAHERRARKMLRRALLRVARAPPRGARGATAAAEGGSPQGDEPSNDMIWVGGVAVTLAGVMLYSQYGGESVSALKEPAKSKVDAVADAAKKK